jgi:DNA anti-recombination protein RmuC
MTTTEVVLLGLVALLALAVVAALRRGGHDDGVSARLDRLSDAVNRGSQDDRAIHDGLGEAREEFRLLRQAMDDRRRSEDQAWGVVRRLEGVLLGGAGRGRAGENLVEETLKQLAPGLLVRDFPVNGKRVEFALVLPDGKRLPVDSKWAAMREVETLEADGQDPTARAALVKRIEDEVARRAREVAAYLDPSITTPFAVACIPDAAFAVCRKAHAEAFARGVVLAPYSTAMPVLLSLYALAHRYGEAGDVRACLTEVEGLLSAMEQTLENKVARASTMLGNASDEFRTQIGRARGALARTRHTRSETAEVRRLSAAQ